jgi:hypothetical protein
VISCRPLWPKRGTNDLRTYAFGASFGVLSSPFVFLVMGVEREDPVDPPVPVIPPAPAGDCPGDPPFPFPLPANFRFVPLPRPTPGSDGAEDIGHVRVGKGDVQLNSAFEILVLFSVFGAVSNSLSSVVLGRV